MGAAFSFGRCGRLLNKEEFARVFKEGRRAYTRNFAVYVLKISEKEKTGQEKDKKPRDKNGNGKRLGISVSADSGNAVGRNRVKRFLREFFRLNREGILAGVGADVVIALKKSARTADLRTYGKVEAELLPAFSKPGAEKAAGR